MLDHLRDELTSFDVFFNEVQVRSLEWSSPAHRSEKFWKDNCFQIEGSQILPMLKGILFLSFALTARHFGNGNKYNSIVYRLLGFG